MTTEPLSYEDWPEDTRPVKADGSKTTAACKLCRDSAPQVVTVASYADAEVATRTAGSFNKHAEKVAARASGDERGTYEFRAKGKDVLGRFTPEPNV